MRKIFFTLIVILVSGQFLNAQNTMVFDHYHKPGEISQWINHIRKTNPDVCRIHEIGASYSGIMVNLLEIGPDVKSKKKSKRTERRC